MDTGLSASERKDPADIPILAPAPRTDPIEIPGRGPVPVTLLTGFLGAGKTTLLNRILTGDHGLKIGVMVNDFGDVNIDASLVEGLTENTVNLANGCICCEIRDDLVIELERLLISQPDIDYVVIEASGVAEPSGIVMTFLDQRYESLFEMDSITCLVDAEGIFSHADDQDLTMLKLRQIGFADLVVLNKSDLVSQDHIEVIREWIGLHMKRVRIIETSMGEVPLEVLLGVGRFAADDIEIDPAAASASALFERWSFTTNRLFDQERLAQMVKRELPESVLRCKGIVFTTDSPDDPMVLQIVGRRTSLSLADVPLDPLAGSSLIAIGKDLDSAGLTELFSGALSDA